MTCHFRICSSIHHNLLIGWSQIVLARPLLVLSFLFQVQCANVEYFVGSAAMNEFGWHFDHKKAMARLNVLSECLCRLSFVPFPPLTLISSAQSWIIRNSGSIWLNSRVVPSKTKRPLPSVWPKSEFCDYFYSKFISFAWHLGRRNFRATPAPWQFFGHCAFSSVVPPPPLNNLCPVNHPNLPGSDQRQKWPN